MAVVFYAPTETLDDMAPTNIFFILHNFSLPATRTSITSHRLDIETVEPRKKAAIMDVMGSTNSVIDFCYCQCKKSKELDEGP